MMHVFAVALGGAAGAVGRYTLTYLVDQSGAGAFPWATVIVNLLGSFLLGFLTGLGTEILVPSRTRALLAVGFLGSFTTFSTYAVESIKLMQSGQWAPALGNLLIMNFAGVFAAFLGMVASRAFVLSLTGGDSSPPL